MSYQKKLVPGLAIEIHIQDGEYQGQYKTHVDEVGERMISVFAPNSQGGVIALREGTKVGLVFWDEVASYAMDTVIVQRIAVPVPVFVLEFPDDIQKIQRRNFVRVPAIYPISFRVIERAGLSDTKKGTMLDLSGGGMRFQTLEKLEMGAILHTFLELPTGEIRTAARVCRVEKVDDTKKFAISLDFYQISERERDQIIRCVFDIQRAMRKKGLV
jgi:c-di-GMP-binding flagellar brake protein YcgR